MARLGFTIVYALVALAGLAAFAAPIGVVNPILSAAWAGLLIAVLATPEGRLGLAATLRRHAMVVTALACLLAFLAISDAVFAGDGHDVSAAWFASAGLVLAWLGAACLTNAGRAGPLLVSLQAVGVAIATISLGLGLLERASVLGGGALSAFMVLGAFATIDAIRREQPSESEAPRFSPLKLALPVLCYLLAFAALAAGQMWHAAIGGLVGTMFAVAGLMARTPPVRRRNALRASGVLVLIPAVILAVAMAQAWSGASTRIATTPVPAQTLDLLRAGWSAHPFLGHGFAALSDAEGVSNAAAAGVFLAETGWLGVALVMAAGMLLIAAMATASERRRIPSTGFALGAGLVVAAGVSAALTPDLLRLPHAAVYAVLFGAAASMADPVRRRVKGSSPLPATVSSTQRL